LPLAIMLADCNTPRNTARTGSSGTTDSATNNSMNAGTSGSMNNNNTSGMRSSGGMYGNVYDPNNYMQNPEKYKRPVDLIKTGGWTYLTDWRVNTNFTPEAVGQWKLVPTPEVASNWVRDTSRPETFASYWTEEAVLGRQQAKMAELAAIAMSDSAMNATGSLTKEGENTSTSNRGRATGSVSSSRSAGRNNRTNRTTESGTTGTGTMSGTTGSGTMSGTTGSGTMSGTTGTGTMSGTTGTGTMSGTTGTGTMSGTTGSGTMSGTTGSGTMSGTTGTGTMSGTTGSGTTGSGTTGSGTMSGTTGSGTMSGTTGSGTMSGTTGSGTMSGTTGTGTMSGTTGSGTMSGTTGSGTTGSGTMSGTTATETMSGTSVSGTLSAMSGSTDSTLIAVNGNRFMMPTINMYIENGTFTGYTGCNNIVGTMKVDGNQLHFENSVPVANIQCIGGFDQSAFLDRLRRADSYDVTNNQLRLKQGGQVLLVFDKNAK